MEEYNRSKEKTDFYRPSFSLGVTQDFQMVLSQNAPVTNGNTYEIGPDPQKEPVKVEPISMCEPSVKVEDVVKARVKRKYTKSLIARSPYRSRVTDLNAAESKEEKKVETWLLNKIGIDESAVLFETETETKATWQQIRSLVNGESIDNRIVDGWSEYLNSLESLRGENSMSRYFLPMFVVDKKIFGRDDKALQSVTEYLMDVEKLNERVGRKNMFLVDLVFIPVNNNGHKFVVCFNLKYPAVNVIDSKNYLRKDGYAKPTYVTNFNDVIVATFVQKGFGKYLVRLNHNKVAVVLSVEVNRDNFYWQSDRILNNSGVFLMRHMEAYMGSVISRCDCGLEAQGKKQNTMLGRLRKRYAATLVLSECNLHKDTIRAQLEEIEGANVPVKKMKLPKVGK